MIKIPDDIRRRIQDKKKRQKRGRKVFIINKSELIYAVEQIEKSQTFNGKIELCKAIEQTDWAKKFKPRSLKYTTIYNFLKRYEIPTVTKSGRGKHFHKKINNLDDIVPEEQDSQIHYETALEMYKEFPSNFHYLVKRYAKNNGMKIAIICKCLDCAGFLQQEVKYCTVNACPLYPHKPWKA